MRFSIRHMVIEDIDSVLEIEKLCFSTPWSRDAFIHEIEVNIIALYLVAESDEGEILGYIGMWKILDEGHITNVAVKPEHRGKGVGSGLVYSVIDYCTVNGIGNITLEVRASNKNAIALYKRMRFEEAGIRPNYYIDNNEDALIMWRKEKLNEG